MQSFHVLKLMGYIPFRLGEVSLLKEANCILAVSHNELILDSLYLENNGGSGHRVLLQ